MPKVFVITIDGPAGAGKSSVAKSLAKRLSFAYLDTGAMYRALTFKALRQKIVLTDEAQLADLANETNIDLQDTPKGLKVLLDGLDVTEEIRSLEVTNNTFYAARASKVREVLVKWQQKIGEQRSVVVEGRDVGTVVFPRADKKFYLDADVRERTRRRVDELRAKGSHVDADELSQEIQQRDQYDKTRSTGPLRQAEDAVYIDSTNLSVADTVELIFKQLPESIIANRLK
jgi:cytidylate kinase